MKYRREIDGLRALAVIPVILFHAGLQTFRGGFVGVDVFFVISGYLITSIIISEMQGGTFTLLEFYERRARRILPALLLVIFTCLPFSIFWLIPRDMADFSKSLIAVSLFASNILFYLKSGYFDPAAEMIPLLHTWSLAVEEQYYVLYPVLMLLLWRLGKRVIVGVLLMIALFSLAAAQWASTFEPMGAFYLLPTRGWELLIGAIISFYLFGKDHNKICQETMGHMGQWLGLIGIALIVYAVLAFDKRIPFPSAYTLIPTIGTALVIVFATEQTLIGKMLSGKALAGIGLISYSAYLWHYPLFAFARHRSIEEPGKFLLLTLALTSLLLAYLSWKWVEKPFRVKGRIKRNHIVVIGSLCSCILVGIGLTGYFNNGYIEGISPAEMRMFYYPDKHARMLYREGSCYLTLDQAPSAFAKDCYATNEVGGTLIWGDSHAAALSIGLRESFTDLIQYTASGCPPMRDVVVPWSVHCVEVNDFVMSEIKRLKPHIIVLHADWNAYKDYELALGLIKTIKYIQSVVPLARVTVVGGVPQWHPSLPKVMLLRGIPVDKERYMETPIWQELVAMDKELELIADGNDARFVSAIENLCVDGKCRIVTSSKEGWALTTWDNAHLTEAGSLLLAKQLLHNINSTDLEVNLKKSFNNY
jgi:peptidoglycan/LPS O-acetylase OafA/YrhL